MKTLARARDKEEILRRLATVRADSPRRWGRMTAPQMICHLTDAFLGVIGELPIRREATLMGRTLVKWFALYAPVNWPSGIPTSPEFDQAAGAGTRPSEFAADVERLRGLVVRVSSGADPAPWTAHPIFGPLTARQWLRWSYLHVDHHLRQFGA
jgi:hypothetical protein